VVEYLRVFHCVGFFCFRRRVRWLSPGKTAMSAVIRPARERNKENRTMATTPKQPASATTRKRTPSEYHHRAATHHAAAAHHHFAAAHHHEMGELQPARKHSEAAQRHSGQAHKHTNDAHEHSKK